MAAIYLIIPVWLLSFAGTWLALVWLRKAAVMDTPNARSNHTDPVPRGGGIAMIAIILVFLALYGVDTHILLAAIMLAAVSFADDIRGLGVHWRLGVQFLAVGLALSAMHTRILPDSVPVYIAWGLMVLAWIWFINLTNFMDGIDGITSMEAIAVCLGICLLTLFNHDLPPSLAVYSSIIAAGVLGFFWFNRYPARIFMGDVGSVSLGFLLGYLLISLAAHGAFISALILPAYYLGDATFTLVKRLTRGDKIWQAHSEHAYQKAVRKGLSHSQVVCKIAGLNMVLIVLAIFATYGIISAGIMLVFACAATAYMLKHLVS